MRAMIIGAGIGGLTAAIALRRSGIEATVFERAGELREVGAWILRRSRVLGRVGQIQDPLLCRPRDAILKVTPVEAQLRLFERVMDHEERPASRRSVRWFA